MESRDISVNLGIVIKAVSDFFFRIRLQIHGISIDFRIRVKILGRSIDLISYEVLSETI